jgi:hypothetical protein
MTMSDNCYLALKDMVELCMYLVAQPQQRPWPMLPRTKDTVRGPRTPAHNPIEWSAANELLTLGFIQHTSSVTLVVSQSGRDFYKHEMARQSD